MCSLNSAWALAGAGEREAGEEAERSLERQVLGLLEACSFRDARPRAACPVSLGYQAIRPVAAARYLATGRRAPVFALVYDAENPYFGGVGDWPGWPRVLEQTLRGQDDKIRFRAISWQELLSLLPSPNELRVWVREKHRLL